MMTELKGDFQLTQSGLKIVRMEVCGKPKESSLNKVCNVLKKITEIAPFLKFLSPLT